MSLLGQERALELCAGALDAARAAGAADAEVSLDHSAGGFTRFANSTFTQAGTLIEPRLRVRVALADGRAGAAVVESLDPALAGDAARRALAVAAAAPPPPAEQPFPGFARPDPARPRPTPRFADATAAAGPGERAAIAARLFARAARDRLVCAGALHTAAREIAVATAAGVRAHAAHTEAALDLIALDTAGDGVPPLPGAASGFARFAGPDLGALDGAAVAALAEQAAADAVRARDAISLDPGEFDVVLAPPAVAEALEWLAMTSLSGRTLVDGSSLLAGVAPGTPLVDERLTLVEDPFHPHPALVVTPHDCEGVPRAAVDFIRAGRSGHTVTDVATAARLGDGRASTGHAPGLSFDLADAPGPAHLILHPGDATTAELVARIDRGLYVSRFHYVNGYLDTRHATMTGMTRDATFLIEGGRITRAVRPLRWTESFLDAFRQRLGGIGSELAASRTTWSNLGTVLCPALWLRRFRFTGTSR